MLFFLRWLKVSFFSRSSFTKRVLWSRNVFLFDFSAFSTFTACWLNLFRFFAHCFSRFCLNFTWLCSRQSNVIVCDVFSSFKMSNSVSPISHSIFLKLYFPFCSANQMTGFYRRRLSSVFVVNFEHISHLLLVFLLLTLNGWMFAGENIEIKGSNGTKFIVGQTHYLC